MKWTVEDDKQLTAACSSTATNHLPDGMLLGVFEHLDAYSRLRKKLVRKMESVAGLKTADDQGRFLNAEYIFAENDSLGKLKELSDTFQVSDENVEKLWEEMLLPVSAVPRRRWRTCGLRQHSRDSLHTGYLESSTLTNTSGIGETYGEAVGNSILLALLLGSKTKRVMFCTSALLEQLFVITPKYPLPRIMWTNEHVEEIVLRECQIIFHPILPEENARGTVSNLILRPRSIEAAGDAADYQPDIAACEKCMEKPLVNCEDKLIAAVGDAQLLIDWRKSLSTVLQE
ncbi:hypothetical protein RvY_06846 [Ramazzottius varieornatus]|uniref:Uncharacterized protein n=1 Tax=Ramazzottius varieornatus TaxID=947166 RepID=A0A1D1V2T7_RAMVA|nr:hypothetical protein RvY_06846 [Ramazzottius varieornatus]